MSVWSDPIRRRRASRAGLRMAALSSIALALSGCLTAKQPAVDSMPIDYRKRHPITIREGERTVELFVGTNRGGLTPQQRADVISFAQSWKREGTGGVIIDAPAGTANARAASETVREARALLAAAGIPAQGVVVRPYEPSDPEQLATVKLNYSKILAQAGPCGLWPHDLGPASGRPHDENFPYYNLGCANQRNLAAMVDNPADLVQPRGEAPAYAARRNTVIEKYRRGEDPAGVYQNVDKAKISDVGK